MYKVNKEKSYLSEPLYVEKWWGYEKTFYNKDYCSKLLYFKKGGSTSMHFHVEKHETLLVVSGELHLEILLDKQITKHILKEQEAWVMPSGCPHKLSAPNGPVTIIESSTKDTPEDSIRIA